MITARFSLAGVTADKVISGRALEILASSRRPLSE